MNQDIRFCTTADGARIAYATLGTGPALLVPAPWVTNIEREFELPGQLAFYEALAQHNTIVRYDRPGCGLSDRDCTEFSLAHEVRYLAAVIDALKLKRVALFGVSNAGPVAIAYAAKQPRRVAHLILYDTYADGARIARDAVKESVVSLIRAHSGLGSQTMADIFLPGADAATLREWARLQRESASAEVAARLLALTYEFNVTDLVPSLRVPTLVLHRDRDAAIPFRLGWELAAAIPAARFVPLECEIHGPAQGNTAPVLQAMHAFLHPRPAAMAAVPAAPPTLLSAVHHGRDAAGYPDGLSRREVEVLRLVATGMSNRDIAAALVISPNTVFHHLSRIFTKTATTNRTEATSYAHRHGLVA